jgi:hypothetical protein
VGLHPSDACSGLSAQRIPGFKGAVLRLHLFTGGQRIKQLVELKAADATRDTITLYDSKGSRSLRGRSFVLKNSTVSGVLDPLAVLCRYVAQSRGH